MAWQSIFLFRFFFFHSHDPSTPDNDTCHRWPSRLKHHFSVWGFFERGCFFWSKGVHIISVQRKKYGWKVFSKNGQFLVNVPWGINQGDFRASRSWDLCFWSLKRFGRFEAVASLDAYQITNYQFPSKTHHFLLPDFRRIREEISKSGILWPIAWAGVIQRFILLFKILPLGARSFFKWFQSERECPSRWIYYQ